LAAIVSRDFGKVFVYVVLFRNPPVKLAQTYVWAFFIILPSVKFVIYCKVMVIVWFVVSLLFQKVF
jgi:hypothetical protein